MECFPDWEAGDPPWVRPAFHTEGEVTFEDSLELLVVTFDNWKIIMEPEDVSGPQVQSITLHGSYTVPFEEQ